VVEFKRFDEDSRTALRGNQVWSQLVTDRRATVAGNLSATYLGALLSGFDRDLTPREIVQSFYKNPGFPLVPSTDEVRRVIFELISGDWELVDAEGNPLTVTSQGQIQINSINQTIRRRQQPDDQEPVVDDAEHDESDQGDLFGDREEEGRATGGGTGGGCGGGGTGTGAKGGGPKVYKRYTVEVANRSITAPDAREQVWQLLKELSKVVDPANGDLDHQLLNLKVTLTTAEGDQGALEAKASQIGAKVHVEEDDF
jgi:hypothetical protein